MRRLLLGLAILFAGCSAGGTLTAPLTGDLEVALATTGSAPDPDGYTLLVDGAEHGVIGVATSLALDELTPGAHTVGLAGVAENCQVQGDNPRTVTVTAGNLVHLDFEVACVEVPAAPENHPPLTVPDEDYRTVVGLPLVITDGGVLYNDSDPDGDPLTAVLVETTSHGTLDFHLDGTFTYTPNSGYTGEDAFVYRASDGKAESADRVVFIWVDAVPMAAADTLRVSANCTLEVAPPGILANDSDQNGDPLAAILSSGPSHGTITNWDTYGGFTYTPEPGFVGTDEFVYRAAEDIGSGSRESLPAKVVIIVE